MTYELLNYKLEKLKDLSNLAKIARGETVLLDTNRLQDDFLTFSGFTSKPALTVRQPRLYKLQGEKARQYAAALSTLGISASTPEAVGIAGAFDNDSLDDAIIIVSGEQLNADQASSQRSYLQPLLENIYSEGHGLIRDFTIHEALYGRVKCMQGDLDLSEAHLFPERLTKGPYQLTVELDTPIHTASKFKSLTELIEQFNQDTIKDPLKVQDATQKAVELRKLLGSLSRYEKPGTTRFTVATNSCVIRNGTNVCFYLFIPETHKNVMVYFGERPFATGLEPKDLTVLSGNQHHYTLARLVELGVYEPSLEVLRQRVADMQTLYDNAARGLQQSLNGSHQDVSGLLDVLQKAEDWFTKVADTKMRSYYLAEMPAEALEFAVYPASEDPVIHELLPRLSWNSIVRHYHDTAAFMKDFSEADETARIRMLSEVSSNILLNNQQNNDVNLWLYKNHKTFCEGNGITFSGK